MKANYSSGGGGEMGRIGKAAMRMPLSTATFQFPPQNEGRYHSYPQQKFRLNTDDDASNEPRSYSLQDVIPLLALWRWDWKSESARFAQKLTDTYTSAAELFLKEDSSRQLSNATNELKKMMIQQWEQMHERYGRKKHVNQLWQDGESTDDSVDDVDDEAANELKIPKNSLLEEFELKTNRVDEAIQAHRHELASWEWTLKQPVNDKLREDKQEIMSLYQRFCRLESECNFVESVGMNTLKEALAEGMEIEKLSHELIEAQRKAGALVHHQNNLRLVFSDIAKIEKEKCEKLHLRQIEVDRLETKLQQAQAETASLVEKLKHDSNGNEELNACTDVTSLNSCLDKLIVTTQAELAEVKHSDAEVQANSAHGMEQIQKLTAEIQQLNNEIERIEIERKKLRAVSSERAQLDASLRARLVELKHKVEPLSSARSTLSELRNLTLRHATENDDQTTTWTSEMKDELQQIQQLQSRIEQQGNQLQTQRQKLSKRIQSNQYVQEWCQRQGHEIKQLPSIDNTLLSACIADSKSHLSQLESNHSKSTNRLEELKRQLNLDPLQPIKPGDIRREIEKIRHRAMELGCLGNSIPKLNTPHSSQSVSSSQPHSLSQPRSLSQSSLEMAQSHLTPVLLSSQTVSDLNQTSTGHLTRQRRDRRIARTEEIPAPMETE